MGLKNTKILLILIISLFLSNCTRYHINVNTLPGDEAEVFVDGAPKGKTDTRGNLEFEYKLIPFYKSPVVYIKSDTYQGWFKCNVEGKNYTYKNVCSFKVGTLDIGSKKIDVTFSPDCKSNEHIALRTTSNTYYYTSDYIFSPPRYPVAQSFLGYTFLTLGISAYIFAIACFSYMDTYEGTESIFNFKELYGFLGGTGLVIGSASLGLGTAFTLGSMYRRKNYYEWLEYQDKMNKQVHLPINISITKKF